MVLDGTINMPILFYLQFLQLQNSPIKKKSTKYNGDCNIILKLSAVIKTCSTSQECGVATLKFVLLKSYDFSGKMTTSAVPRGMIEQHFERIAFFMLSDITATENNPKSKSLKWPPHPPGS